MKCNRIAVYGWKSKAGMKCKSRILYSFKTLGDAYNYKDKIGILFDRIANQCEGNIISKIELEYIPYMGGTEAIIEVRFRCNKCGHEYANKNGLPYDVDSLNEFLTKIIEERK